MKEDSTVLTPMSASCSVGSQRGIASSSARWRGAAATAAAAARVSILPPCSVRAVPSATKPQTA
eukprot:6203162-Pleurochrysis_carterae.AAC.3